MTVLTSLQLTFEPLSPIHIGSGEQVDPLEYLLVAREQEHWLVRLNLPHLLSRLSQENRRTWLGLIERGHMPAIQKWLREQAEPEDYLFSVQIPDFQVSELLSRDIASDRAQAQVDLFTRHAATGCPYLPGSSLKGSIRTAVLQHWLSEEKSQDPILRRMAQDQRPNAAAFEARVMGNEKAGGQPDLGYDPFRQLAISDIILPMDACYIDQITIRRSPDKGGASDPSGIRMYRDITWSRLDGDAIAYSGQVRFHEGLARNGSLQRKITPQLIIEACRNYYLPTLRRQLEQLENWGVDPADLAPLRQIAEHPPATGCPIRLGRHSHFECVTFRAPHHLRPKRGFGETRSLANNASWPLGWAWINFQGAASSAF